MPAKSTKQHRRTHNLLLISKLLNQNDSASPLTLIIDNLEQSGKHLVWENLHRAKSAKTQIIYVSFETLRKPAAVDVFVEAWNKPFDAVRRSITSQLANTQQQRTLIVIDSLNALCSQTGPSSNIPSLLASFFAPNVSLLGVYHADCPSNTTAISHSPYTVQSLTLLRYIATAILTTYSLPQILAQKAARDRSVAEPVFGLAQGTNGVLVGEGSNGDEGTAFEMEYRRKSGRGVRDWYFLPRRAGPLPVVLSGSRRETVVLLEDHSLYARPIGDDTADENELDVTFELGLTERQRRDRDGVVLPYFDAQKGTGGEGGRILYDMDAEDDFDEEEDEI